MNKIYRILFPVMIFINFVILICFCFLFISKMSFTAGGGLLDIASIMAVLLEILILIIWASILLDGYILFFKGYISLVKYNKIELLKPCLGALPASILSVTTLFIFGYYYLFGFSLTLNILAAAFYILIVLDVKNKTTTTNDTL